MPIFLTGLIALSVAQEARIGQEGPPKPFLAKVVRVADGDTITVLFEGKEHEIRLETIDAPERNQPHGQKAKEVLSGKLLGRDVKIVWKSKDKYKRIRGQVFLGDRRMCQEMLVEGYAWHYTQFDKDPQLAKAEKDAREAKRGLWADAKPIAPWDFRKKMGNHESEDPAKEIVYVTGGGKKYHIKDCRYLTKTNPTETTLEKVVQRKLEPCSVCKPPIVAPVAKGCDPDDPACTQVARPH
jgi:endonuclease YncB( thermonuclease family)